MSPGTASCVPAVLETTLPGLLALVSVVLILSHTLQVKRLQSSTTEMCYKLDWDKGRLGANVSLFLRGMKHLRVLQSTGCPLMLDVPDSTCIQRALVYQ